VSFQGTVYDITAIIPWHPGGPGKIIPYCGSAEEFAGAFTRKHGTSMVSIMMKMATKKGALN
jgi:cytochrome b involved in lipid metabolism